MNSAGCCPFQVFLRPSPSAPRIQTATLAVQTDLQGGNRSLSERGRSEDLISALSFGSIWTDPMSMCGPAASTEPAATSPEITCRSDTRAGSIQFLPQIAIKRQPDIGKNVAFSTPFMSPSVAKLCGVGCA